MKKVLVIVGPTAVGKSDYGVSLAKKFNGEIISGDSIQVYRGLDIGSGKVSQVEMDGVTHHLIDILDASDDYSVADFQRNARACIEDITSRNKLPIIVGGTGLYVKACLYDYEFAKQEERQEMSDYAHLDNDQLHQLLESLDSDEAKVIHKNNRKRVVRAIHIAKSGVSKSESEKAQNHTMIYDALLLGLTCERSNLYNRINLRVEKMVDNGLLNEINCLLNSGVTFKNHSMQGIGYREWSMFFEGTMSLEEVIASIQMHSRQFAKRQYTWFNNQMPVHWLNIEEENWKENGIEEILSWRK